MFNHSSPPPADGKKIAALVKRTKNGDVNAFGELYILLVEPIYRYIYFRVDSKESAEDIVQDVFIKAYQKLHQFEKGSFNAWLYSITKNKVVDYYRTHKQHSRLNPNTQNESSINQTQVIEDLIDIDIIRSKLKLLPNMYREVIIMRYLQDLSIKETAQFLEMSESNVKVISHRAITKLKQLVNS